LTEQEQFIIAQLNRVRKLMPFLRRHRVVGQNSIQRLIGRRVARSTP
jgi:hypothetical protein